MTPVARLTKLRCGIAVAAFLYVVVSVTPARADKAHPVIGFIAYDMTSFISLGKQGAQVIADANGATLIWASAQSDEAKQLAQFQKFVDQKVDAIVIAPLPSMALGTRVAAAKTAGISVIITNLKASDDAMATAVSYVGPDDVKAGESEATHLMAGIGHKGGVVILQGPLGGSAELDRSLGINNVLANNPDVHLLAAASANWRRTEAYSLTQSYITRFGVDLTGIIAENDDMALGAIQALRESNLLRKVRVTGIDGIKEGMRNVQSGAQLETNLQDAMLELGLAVQIAVDNLQGRPVPRSAMLIMPEVTKANVGHYYDQMFVNIERFKTDLPLLVRKNLAAGTYADQ